VNVLERIEKRVRRAVEVIDFEVNYYSGVTEDLDIYEVSCASLEIKCFGPTELKAIESAKADALAKLMENAALTEKILRSIKKSRDLRKRTDKS
jgi:hypothetical protein